MNNQKRKRDSNSLKHSNRKEKSRGNPYPAIFLYCDGQTEEDYFRHLGIRNPKIMRCNIDGYIEKAIDDKKKRVENEEDWDEYWIVCDKDDVSDEIFDNSIKKAEENKIHVAYSNEAFECWLLLHFQYFETAFNRKDYPSKINTNLKNKQIKSEFPANKSINKELFDSIFLFLDTAKANTKKLHEKWFNENINRPSKQNPNTTIIKLIEKLQITE